MKPSRAFFSIIKYRPIPGDDYTLNVGLLVLSSDFHFIQAQFLPDYFSGQLKNGAARWSDDLEPVFAHSDGQLSPAMRSFGNLTQLKEFVADFSDRITLSAAVPRKITDPVDELRSLYELYVVRQHQPSEARLRVSPLSCVAC